MLIRRNSVDIYGRNSGMVLGGIIIFYGQNYIDSGRNFSFLARICVYTYAYICFDGIWLIIFKTHVHLLQLEILSQFLNKLLAINKNLQSNLYKSATFGSGLNWLLYTGVCLIKVESEMSL